jgi:CPA2 family monovalent cation:H+ antiporter-2
MPLSMLAFGSGEVSAIQTSFASSSSAAWDSTSSGVFGRSIGSQLETFGHDVCIVDLSPINLHSFAQQGFQTVAGDATDVTVLERAGVDGGELVVVCVPDDGTATRIVKSVRRLNRNCRIIVRCRYQSNLRKINKAGATDIVAEESEAALALMRLLERSSQDIQSSTSR